MHELSVCQAMIAQVADAARARGMARVTGIEVGIGPLSGVEADLLEDAFPFAAAGTLADGAELRTHRIGVRVRCSTCERETDATANRLVCGHCGDWRTALVNGDELILERIEMTRETELDTGEVVSV
jgi:hydrogenase nickel incorporation protein HypA/HybF